MAIKAIIGIEMIPDGIMKIHVIFDLPNIKFHIFSRPKRIELLGFRVRK